MRTRTGRRHERRMFDVIDRAGEPWRHEFRAARAISFDAYREIAFKETALGPLGDVIDGATSALEHYSHPPSHDEASVCLAKAGELALRARSGRRIRQAALAIVCRCGVGALERLGLVATAHTGWRCVRIGLATIHVLDASQLAADGTWGVLRAAANPPGVSTQDLIAELNADPRLPKHLKDSITREFMNQHIANTSRAEQKTAADIDSERSFLRGVEEATSEALSVMMPVARAVLTPAELAALGASPTLAEVRDALRGRVPGL